MIVKESRLEKLKMISKGKVRDIYDLDKKLLIVTTDRMSAFDRILHEPIPYKGMVLNNLSLFWFDLMKDIIPNHVAETDIEVFPEEARSQKEVLYGRSVIVHKAEPLKVECIVRGYITGSGWNSYRQKGEICGLRLPPGLKESEMLEEPLFTPTTKADEGHDENITFDEMKELIGEPLAEELKEKSLAIYLRARDYAAQRGIIIADTKMEFGIYKGSVIIIDELLTPDSSRFWPARFYEAGRSQESFDKQYLRDWLTGTGWDKDSDPPHLPEEVVRKTQDKYLEAYRLLTGKDLLQELRIG
ncbi:MAG TPA: phosphoribosylaminoimidazolesuccinocarboxamide synthase [Candidatus Mcinerneyibacteriales bacterium]|nr:phosphoribosylaminoimidazolesuccinocarboxamide synthase [Candidatus Mcinerneyibacteriales bacterium]HPE19752.1 phosphoribosylaminoimidazolesuccinocarboxamide synthase [Candidatus Mcinerneyibacteriales bacterium]HPJ70207.1 phosphoribosylaminoimidazolesuccinocarboxamide synthase [Candidatus Mcinerneyibacteriales bacterium]HPQ89536.1 phosphoribosylaminoimidazolesuccinocarboxamide synthase [Candidatus Mcinerneyibacteriales bacterium]